MSSAAAGSRARSVQGRTAPAHQAQQLRPLQVSARERLVLQSDVAAGRLPLSIGPLHSAVAGPSDLAALLERHRCAALGRPRAPRSACRLRAASLQPAVCAPVTALSCVGAAGAAGLPAGCCAVHDVRACGPALTQGSGCWRCAGWLLHGPRRVRLCRGQRCMLSFCPDDGRGWWRRLLLRKPAQLDRLALCLRQDAGPRDILQGALQVRPVGTPLQGRAAVYLSMEADCQGALHKPSAALPGAASQPQPRASCP